MPRLLKRETNRRLTVAQKALTTAFTALAIPRSIGQEPNETDGAIEIGLIGIAADLAISACLYEVHGVEGILNKQTRFYLTASAALESFRKTLSSSTPRRAALTQSVADPVAHLEKLRRATDGFSVIFTARAAAVHGGAGTSYDVAFYAGKLVADFLLTLADSPNWKPYLKQVPALPSLPKERTLIAQELAALLSAGDKSKAGSCLSGIYLVLPELTEKVPAWLETLERVQITPRSKDISVLLKSLEKGSTGELYKVGKGAAAIAARIDPTNPNAIPVSLQSMKKKFEQLADNWSGYVGAANGQLDKSILSLPPVEALYQFSAAGMDGIGLPPEELEAGLPAQSVWPFVAAALDYSGTKGPCFYVVRRLKMGEFGQFSGILTKAAARSKKLRKALADYNSLFDAVANNHVVLFNTQLGKRLAIALGHREKRREQLDDVLKGRVKEAAGKEKIGFERLLTEVQESDSLVGPLTLLAEDKIQMGGGRFPAMRLLLDAANAREDVAPIASILSNKALEPVATNARKAIMEIDYSFFGPQIA